LGGGEEVHISRGNHGVEKKEVLLPQNTADVTTSDPHKVLNREKAEEGKGETKPKKGKMRDVLCCSVTQSWRILRTLADSRLRRKRKANTSWRSGRM